MTLTDAFTLFNHTTPFLHPLELTQLVLLTIHCCQWSPRFPWASPNINPAPIRVHYLQDVVAPKWDAATPPQAVPSAVFIRRYEVIEQLDGLIERRKSWQRSGPSAAAPNPPDTLGGGTAAVMLW